MEFLFNDGTGTLTQVDFFFSHSRVRNKLHAPQRAKRRGRMIQTAMVEEEGLKMAYNRSSRFFLNFSMSFHLSFVAQINEKKLDRIITVVPQNVADDPHGGKGTRINKGEIDGEGGVFLPQTLACFTAESFLFEKCSRSETYDADHKGDEGGFKDDQRRKIRVGAEEVPRRCGDDEKTCRPQAEAGGGELFGPLPGRGIEFPDDKGSRSRDEKQKNKGVGDFEHESERGVAADPSQQKGHEKCHPGVGHKK